MAIKVCPNGHHYNTDDNPTCPYCEKTGSTSNYEWSEMDLSSTAAYKTEPLSGWGSRGDDNWTAKTEPINTYANKNSQNDRNDGENNWIGKTVAIGQSGGFSTQTQDPGVTQIAWNDAEYKHQPVVGWLVCIEGPDKGKDFELHGAKSTIGRRKDSSVTLSDPKISRDGFPALIVYDDRKSHKFYLASGDAQSHNNVELGGDMLLGQSVINPYDEIRIENTVLVFVPFCGEDFFWKEN